MRQSETLETPLVRTDALTICPEGHYIGKSFRSSDRFFDTSSSLERTGKSRFSDEL